MKKYTKPVLRLQKKNNFVLQILENHVKKPVTGNQCSSCHSCRG